MVRDKKPLLRKYDRSARDGHLYGNPIHAGINAQDTIQHDEEVAAKVKKLREENVGKDVIFFEVRRPHPDIIQVDYEKRETTAWELSKADQLSAKRRLYENHHEWSHVKIVQIEKGIEKKSTFLWRRSRYRRIKKS